VFEEHNLHHLALSWERSLSELVQILASTFGWKLEHGVENETEWYEGAIGQGHVSVSRPHEPGALHQWNAAVPEECTIGIALRLEVDDADGAWHQLGQALADRLQCTVYAHGSFPGQQPRRAFLPSA
jgi:hypothetical protein